MKCMLFTENRGLKLIKIRRLFSKKNVFSAQCALRGDAPVAEEQRLGVSFSSGGFLVSRGGNGSGSGRGTGDRAPLATLIINHILMRKVS